MRVAAVNIQAGRINRSRFKKRLEGCKFAHMTAGVRCVLPGMMYVAKVRGGGTPNGFVIHPLISFITPLHIPHHEPGSGGRERVIDREGMMKKKSD
jgi:hypothetical protein